MNKLGRKRGDLHLFLIGIALLFSIFEISSIISATSFSSSNNANLTIWDDTDDTYPKSTVCNEYCSAKNKVSITDWNFYFYANYTNATTGSSIAEGNCTINFGNYSGGYSDLANMSYNSTYQRFQSNLSFNYKGNYLFNVNCSNSSSLLVNASDNFTISNTPPWIFSKLGYIDFDPPASGLGGDANTLQCSEDTLCYYDFSQNVSEDDANEALIYGYASNTNTTLTNFTLNSASGMLLINITHSSETGTGKTVELNVLDSSGPLQSALLRVDVANVNDAPVFNGLENESFNMSEVFSRTITVTDEENNVPFKLNITFLNCSTAAWSWRNNTNCSLFNESQYSFDNTTGVLILSFTPNKSEVGNYIINFTITDSGTSNPANASTSRIVNFTVLNQNSAPQLTYVCNNERNGSEDSEFTCQINASDIDELNNLTFTANYSWFTFNNSLNSITLPINIVGGNVSATVNFIPRDLQVGNWSVNLTVRDSDNLSLSTTSISNFYFANANDSINLVSIQNQTVWTSSTSIEFYINASDDDLLIPDKNVFDENLTFYSNNSNLAINNYLTISETNITMAQVSFDPNNFVPNSLTYINISAVDKGNWSISSRIFYINVSSNSPPQWNETLNRNQTMNESANYHLELSANVSDADGDSITFSFVIEDGTSSFPSFSLSSAGVADFTPVDADVGFHAARINASDGKAQNQTFFNFTVNNQNDVPLITRVYKSTQSAGLYGEINTTEDNATTIYLYVEDDDFKIPSSQRSFYNESLNVSLNILGNNNALFSFLIITTPMPGSNNSIYQATFTPNKSDVGSYNITINVTDNSNSSNTFAFNLSILETEHAPVLSEIENQTLAINETLYIDLNATDTEDINETYGNLTYKIENLTAGGDFLTINSSNGIINLTLNESHSGVWEYNISVNDSSGRTDSQLFRMIVYDYPQVFYPESGYNFSLEENANYNITFAFNHSVGMILNDTLNCTLYINGVIKNQSIGNGNGTNTTLSFSTNFTEETFGEANVTLFLQNPKLNTTASWNLTIAHVSYPLTLTTNITDKSGGSSVSFNLSSYFTDWDATDPRINQTVGFTYELLNNTATGGTITVEIQNWTNATTPTITFSTSASSSGLYEITGFEYNGSSYNSSILRNATSNNFTVTLSIQTITTPVTSSTTVIKLVVIKLILPGPISTEMANKIVVPVGIMNEGRTTLTNIKLSSLVLKNGTVRTDLKSYFDTATIASLEPGQVKNVSLTIEVSDKEFGLYEINVNATVESPALNDWGKIYVNIREGTKIEEKVVFTEELIASNPECVELKEIVNEARRLIAQKDILNAEKKLNEAVEACQKAITQKPAPKIKEKTYESLVNYVIISSVSAFIIGMFYYYYRRIRIE